MYSIVWFALVLVPGLVSLLRTHAQLMLSSTLVFFPLSPLSLILQLQVQFQFASCVSVCVPRTDTTVTLYVGYGLIFLCVLVCAMDRHNSHIVCRVWTYLLQAKVHTLRLAGCDYDNVCQKKAFLLKVSASLG